MICKKCKKEVEDDSAFCRFCGCRLRPDAPSASREPSRSKAMKRPNGMGTVYKCKERRQKPWCAQMSAIDKNGTKKRVLIGYFERKTDALQVLEKITNSGGLPQFFNITVEGVHEEWMEKHYPQISQSGVQNYNSAWRYFDEKTRKMKMSDLKAYHIQAIVNAAVEKGLSNSSCEKIKQLASQLCQWAMQNDIVDKNYAQFVEINAVKSTPREPFTTDELRQIRQYYATSGDKTAGAILLLCHTGLRMDELLAMKKSDYFNGCLHGGSKTEKGMHRSVPVPDIMFPILDDLLLEPGEYIISNANGERYDAKNWRNRRYYKTLAAAGFPKELIKRRTPHSCRHTYATMCSRLKMDDKALQDILGHEDISTTKNIYTHTDEEYLKGAAKNLDFFRRLEE